MLKKYGVYLLIIGLMLVTQDGVFAQDSDSLAQNKASIEKLYEFLNAHNTENIEDLVATRQLTRGFQNDYADFFAAFPDAHFTIEQLIGEDDLVMARVIVTATHQGRFLGIPPTDQQVEFSTMNLFRFENGKIAETWQTTGVELMIELDAVIPNNQ